MLKNLIETIFSRGLNSIGNLGIVLITAGLLGSSGRGELSLFVLNIGIISIFQNIGSGSAVAYFSNKLNLNKIWIFSFFWAVSISLIVGELLYYYDLSYKSHRLYLLVTSIFLGLTTTNQNILLGNEKLRKMNIIESLKSILVVFGILILYFFTKIKIDVIAVLYIYMVSYFLLFLYSYFEIISIIKKGNLDELEFRYKSILNFGIQIQSTNFLQLINYRFIYFVVEKYFGTSTLGILSVAISIAENVWIISKSTSTVLYSRLLNMSDKKEKVKLTVFYTKISFVYSIILCSLLLLIPEFIFKVIFGKTFEGINTYLLFYSPAVILFSFFSQFNIYFTANNQNLINIKATSVGAICTIILSFCLIPYFGAIYASFSISISYMFMTIFLYINFKKKTQTKFIDFFVNIKEVFKISKNPTL